MICFLFVDNGSYFKSIEIFGNVNKPLDSSNNVTHFQGFFQFRPEKKWRFAANDLGLKAGDAVYYGITIKTHSGQEDTSRNLFFKVVTSNNQSNPRTKRA